jgi:hypothetical protein
MLQNRDLQQLGKPPLPLELLVLSACETAVGDPRAVLGPGLKQGQPTRVCSTFTHPNTAVAAGIGTGSIGQLLLSGALDQPGLWTPETALPTALFEQTLAQRGGAIARHLEPLDSSQLH